MLTRGPDQIPDLAKHKNRGTATTAERNNGGTEPTAECNRKGTEPIVDITSEAQADRPQSKLRKLWEELKNRSVTLFRQALERLRNSTNQTAIDELKANNSQAESKNNTSKKGPRMTRRDFLRFCGAATAAAVAVFLPEDLRNNSTAFAAEARTSQTRTEPNSETEVSVPELQTIITEAKYFIASKVPMLEAYTDTLQPMERTNATIGLQIPSDIGNSPSPDPKKPNKSGFELGSRIYSPYLDSNDQEKGVIYQSITDNLKKITELKEYKSASPEKQKEMLLRYLNSLAEQILERQKRYSAAVREFPGKPTRVGIGAEVVKYVDFMANTLGITDPDIKAAILRTHPHVAQIIAMQQAGFDVDIQMNGLPPRFVEPDGDNQWPIFNPIKPDAIQAFTEFVRILSLALSTEFRMSTANEPANIHTNDQAKKYAERLIRAQLDLIKNNPEVTLIGPSIKTDYKGGFNTTFRIIESFIAEIEKCFIAEIEKIVIENNNTDPVIIINKLLSCLPTLTVYSRDADAFMKKANRLVDGIGTRIQGLLQRLTEKGLLKPEDLGKVKVRVNFSEMGIEWPYYQGDSGLKNGTKEMIKIVENLKPAIEKWKESYRWLEFTGIFFIHNPGGPDYGEEFNNYARQTTSGIPVGESSIPVIGRAPNTEHQINKQCFGNLCRAVG